MRFDCKVRSLYPPAPVLQVFNFTLRRNNVRFDCKVRSLYPPAPVLQATVFRTTSQQMDAQTLNLAKNPCVLEGRTTQVPQN